MLLPTGELDARKQDNCVSYPKRKGYYCKCTNSIFFLQPLKDTTFKSSPTEGWARQQRNANRSRKRTELGATCSLREWLEGLYAWSWHPVWLKHLMDSRLVYLGNSSLMPKSPYSTHRYIRMHLNRKGGGADSWDYKLRCFVWAT